MQSLFTFYTLVSLINHDIFGMFDLGIDLKKQKQKNKDVLHLNSV